MAKRKIKVVIKEEKEKEDKLPHWLRKDKKKGDKKVDKKGDSEEESSEEKPNTDSVNVDLANFLKAVTEENYAGANKYLRGAVDKKLVNAIRNSAKR